MHLNHPKLHTVEPICHGYYSLPHMPWLLQSFGISLFACTNACKGKIITYILIFLNIAKTELALGIVVVALCME